MVEGHGPPGTRGHGGDEGVADICPTLPPDASGVTTLPRSGAIAQHESAPETDRACGTVSRDVGRVEGHIDGPGACQMVGMDARIAGYQTSHRLVRHRTPDDAHHPFGPGGHAAACVIPHPQCIALQIGRNGRNQRRGDLASRTAEVAAASGICFLVFSPCATTANSPRRPSANLGTASPVCCRATTHCAGRADWKRLLLLTFHPGPRHQ